MPSPELPEKKELFVGVDVSIAIRKKTNDHATNSEKTRADIYGGQSKPQLPEVCIELHVGR